jgi:hypothetical protein
LLISSRRPFSGVAKGIPTITSIAEEEAWSSLVFTQLENVRKSAENWRNGLVAMIGVITGFSLVKGPDQIGDLESWCAISIGVLLAMALICAICGTCWALAAAYGIPEIVSRDSFKTLGGLVGFQLDLATKSASNLIWARRAAILALLLAAISVGLAWYGPRPTTLLLKVARVSGPEITGKLVSSESGYIDLKSADSSAVRIFIKDIVKISAGKESP